MKKEELLAEALKRFDTAQSFEREDRDLAAEDFRFAAGEQWPITVRQARERENRPCLTYNRLPQFIRQVTGEARQNKPAIKVVPVDDGSDVDLAEIYSGLIRNIENQSHADEVYISAFENAVTGGIGGGWRVVTEYTNDDAFDQDIRLKRITNPFAITWDPGAKEFDKSDAAWCFVHEWITKEQFEARFPKNVPADWVSDFRAEATRHWINGERVRLAEYWVKKPVKKTLGMFEGRVIEVTPALSKFTYEQTREVDAFEVCRYLLSGHDVLEGPDPFPSKYIPIVPCFGPEEWIDDRVRHVSLIRHAKDPQRAYNYWQTVIAEKIALAPKSPWLVTPTMIAGLEDFWNRANTSNDPYLPYNQDGGMRPTREAPAAVNSAEIQQSAQAIDDLKATMGMYDASLGASGNETSGRAIIARQREGDNATFAWIDNLARSIQHTGRILVDIIPKIYDTQRIVRILGEDGSQEMTPINWVQGMEIVNDITVGKYDVEITVGPSYRTRRQESAESMLAFVQAMPQAAAVAADLIARNLDWPGADEIADRLKRSLPPQITSEEEVGPAPDPMQGIAMAKAEAEIEGNKLDNAKKQVELSTMTGEMQQLVQMEVQRLLASMFEQPQGPMAMPMG
jgi:hypothetical protein